MLTGHKKSRYNIYDNLEFLGLNPYELKHFCFGEAGSDDAGGDYDADIANAVAQALGSALGGPETAAPAPDAPTAGPSAAAGLAAGAATSAASQAAGQAAAAAGNVGGPEDSGSVDFFDTQFEVDPFDIAEFNISAPKSTIDVLTRMAEQGQKGIDRVQDLLNARQFSRNALGIPEMNKLEKAGLKTFGLGYRGDFEARSPFGLFRDDYDPNSLTGAGTDEASTNKSMFAQFARDNRDLTTVEAVAQYNAISNPDQQVSISDVQSMGFDLNAPVGPQADYREAEAQRGLAQGIGLVAQTIAAGSPMGALTDIALSGSGKGYGKGVMGHMADMFEEATGVDLPEAPDLGIPSFAEIASNVFGPEEDTMDPASFGITGVTEESIGPEAFGFADLSTPTDEEVGFTGFGTVGDYDLGFGGSEPIAPPPVQKPVIKEKEEVIEIPSPSFPVRDTTPPSRVSRIANIYGIDEDAAKRMLGIV